MYMIGFKVPRKVSDRAARWILTLFGDFFRLFGPSGLGALPQGVFDSGTYICFASDRPLKLIINVGLRALTTGLKEQTRVSA